MFCPTKPVKDKHKPKKSRNSDGVIPNNNNHDNHHATSTPYRFIKSEFIAKAEDELTVFPDDMVLFQYTDHQSGDWSRVIHLRTHKAGFVPTEILTTETKQTKKLPRNSSSSSEHHHHLHHSHHQIRHHHNTHHISSGQPSSNGDNIRLHQHVPRMCHQQPKFELPASYYNIRPSDPHLTHYNDISNKCRLFHREDCGLYLVTYNFVAREENDLDVKPGEFVTVLNKEDEDWYWIRRDYDSSEGFVPSKFICDYEQVKSSLNKGSTVTMKSSHMECHTYMNQLIDRESLITDQQSLCHNI